MGIIQGMEPAGRAPAVLGSPFPGIPGLCVPGRGHGGTPEHRETPPGGLSNLGGRDGVYREREGDEWTLSQLQAVLQLWGCFSSAVPSSIPHYEGPGVGLLVPQVTGGEQSPWVLLPVPGISLL